MHVNVQGANVAVLGDEPLEQVCFRQQVQDGSHGALHVGGVTVDLGAQGVRQIVQTAGLRKKK